MKPDTNPNHIALYTALAITAFYGVMFVVVSVIWYGFKTIPFLISTTLIFFFVYLSIGFSLNTFIYENIKTIYKTIGDFRKIHENEKVFFKKNESLQKAHKVVLEWGEQQKKEIEELKQMAAYRREFLGNISHELKTPIFNIQGYILTLLDGGLQDESVNKAFLKKANKSINRMIAIVEDLDEISKLESGVAKLRMKPFNLSELTSEVIELMEMKAAENNTVIDFKQKHEPLTAYADKKRIRQVFVNLIENAIKYGDKHNNRIKIEINHDDNRYVVKISDNGPGIEKENLPRVFERFYRTDKGRSRDKGGTGLGLAIVKHIIEAHRQSITVKSKKGKGTTFAFTIDKAKSDLFQ